MIEKDDTRARRVVAGRGPPADRGELVEHERSPADPKVSRVLMSLRVAHYDTVAVVARHPERALR